MRLTNEPLGCGTGRSNLGGGGRRGLPPARRGTAGGLPFGHAVHAGDRRRLRIKGRRLVRLQGVQRLRRCGIPSVGEGGSLSPAPESLLRFACHVAVGCRAANRKARLEVYADLPVSLLIGANWPVAASCIRTMPVAMSYTQPCRASVPRARRPATEGCVRK